MLPEYDKATIGPRFVWNAERDELQRLQLVPAALRQFADLGFGQDHGLAAVFEVRTIF